MTELHEVITVSPDSPALRPAGRAFGQTFTDRATALAYARAMRRAGYSADVSPVFTTVDTITAALRQAARFYDNARLSQDASDIERKARL